MTGDIYSAFDSWHSDVNNIFGSLPFYDVQKNVDNNISINSMCGHIYVFYIFAWDGYET